MHKLNRNCNRIYLYSSLYKKKSKQAGMCQYQLPWVIYLHKQTVWRLLDIYKIDLAIQNNLVYCHSSRCTMRKYVLWRKKKASLVIALLFFSATGFEINWRFMLRQTSGFMQKQDFELMNWYENFLNIKL